jgi:hypothetical protein
MVIKKAEGADRFFALSRQPQRIQPFREGEEPYVKSAATIFMPSS